MESLFAELIIKNFHGRIEPILLLCCCCCHSVVWCKWTLMTENHIYNNNNKQKTKKQNSFHIKICARSPVYISSSQTGRLRKQTHSIYRFLYINWIRYRSNATWKIKTSICDCAVSGFSKKKSVTNLWDGGFRAKLHSNISTETEPICHSSQIKHNKLENTRA